MAYEDKLICWGYLNFTAFFECTFCAIKYYMTEVFEVCEENFYTNLREAQKLIKNPSPTPISMPYFIEPFSKHLSHSRKHLNKEQIIDTVKQNVNLVQHEQIDIFKDEIRTFKKELNKLENKLKEEHVEQNSGPLFDSEEQEKGINPLIEAKRQMYENEHMANEAATGIKRNNEILMKNINRMGDINNELTVAHKLLNSIKNKLRKNKLIMFGTLAFLFLVLVVIIYSYVKGSSTTTTIIETKEVNNGGSG